MVIVFLLLTSFSLLASVTELDSSSLGLEILQLGTGHARLGSSGALNSNPSLLAFLPKKKQFTSSNQIFIVENNEKSENAGNAKPDVIPRYAVTTTGTGSSGWGYGVSTFTFNVDFTSTDNDQRSDFSAESSDLSLLGGYGVKCSTHSAIGISLGLNRNFSFTRGDFELLDGSANGVFRSETNVWTTWAAVGFSSEGSVWNFGYSTKINLFKLSHSELSRGTVYVDGIENPQTTKDSDKTNISYSPIHTIGVSRSFGSTDYFLDLRYRTGYKDSTFDTRVTDSLTIANAFEQILFESKYTLHEALLYKFIPSGKSDANGENLGASLGISEKGDHSLNYVGLGYTKDLFSEGQTTVQLNFGTTFDY